MDSEILEIANNGWPHLPQPNLTFATTSEARQALVAVISKHSSMFDSSSAVESFGPQFMAWSRSFGDLVDKRQGPNLSLAERRSIALLQLHKYFISICLLEINPENWEIPLTDDCLEAFFHEMLDYAEIAILGEEAPEAAAQPRFHMDIGVTPALFSIVLRSQEDSIRRRSIALLDARHLQEGVWNSVLAAKVAQRVLELEEKHRGKRSEHVRS